MLARVFVSGIAVGVGAVFAAPQVVASTPSPAVFCLGLILVLTGAFGAATAREE